MELAANEKIADSSELSARQIYRIALACSSDEIRIELGQRGHESELFSPSGP